MSGHSPDYDWNVLPAARLATAGGPARARREASSINIFIVYKHDN